MNDDSYSVEVETRFDARHCVAPDGAPSAAHGHRWQVRVQAASSELDRIAIVVDFRRLLELTDSLLEPLQGGQLEEITPFDETAPTAPAVAGWLLHQLRAQTAGENYRVTTVTVCCDPGMDFIVGENAE